MRNRKQKNKVIPLHCRKKPQLSLSQIITIGLYKRQIKELKKNNIALAIALQEERAKVSHQDDILRDYARDTNAVSLAKIKLKNISSDLNNIFEHLNIIGHQESWHRDLKMQVKKPDESPIPEADSQCFSEDCNVSVAVASKTQTISNSDDSATQVYFLSPTDILSKTFIDESKFQCNDGTPEIPSAFPQTHVSSETPPSPLFSIPSPPKINKFSNEHLLLRKFNKMNPENILKSSNGATSKIPVHMHKRPVQQSNKRVLLDNCNPDASTPVTHQTPEPHKKYIFSEVLENLSPMKANFRRDTYLVTSSPKINPNPTNHLFARTDKTYENPADRTVILCEDMEFTEVIPTHDLLTLPIDPIFNDYSKPVPPIGRLKNLFLKPIGENLNESASLNRVDSQPSINYYDSISSLTPYITKKDNLTKSHCNVSKLMENINTLNGGILSGSCAKSLNVELSVADSNLDVNTSGTCNGGKSFVPHNLELNLDYGQNEVNVNIESFLKSAPENSNYTSTKDKTFVFDSVRNTNINVSNEDLAVSCCQGNEKAEKGIFDFSPSFEGNIISKTKQKRQKPTLKRNNTCWNSKIEKSSQSIQEAIRLSNGTNSERKSNKLIYKSRNVAINKNTNQTEGLTTLKKTKDHIEPGKNTLLGSKSELDWSPGSNGNGPMSTNKQKDETSNSGTSIVGNFQSKSQRHNNGKNSVSVKNTRNFSKSNDKNQNSPIDEHTKTDDLPHDISKHSSVRNKRNFSGVSKRGSKQRTTACSDDLFEDIGEVWSVGLASNPNSLSKSDRTSTHLLSKISNLNITCKEKTSIDILTSRTADCSINTAENAFKDTTLGSDQRAMGLNVLKESNEMCPQNTRCSKRNAKKNVSSLEGSEKSSLSENFLGITPFISRSQLSKKEGENNEGIASKKAQSLQTSMEESPKSHSLSGKENTPSSQGRSSRSRSIKSYRVPSLKAKLRR